MDQHNNRKPSRAISTGGVLLRVAVLLICLVMLCVHLLGSLYAKYSSNSDGDDGARVAKFSLDITGETEGIAIHATTGNSGEYVVNVKNDSEVAVTYDIIVTLDQAMPDLVVMLGSETLSTEDHKVFTLSNAGILAPNAPQVSHSLTFSLSSWDDFTADKTGEEAQLQLQFAVTVFVQQVD